MPKISSPHVAIEGSGGGAGELRGHPHASSPVDGLTYQCAGVHQGVVCGHVYQVAWDELDALNEPLLEREPSECVHLPDCPACGCSVHLVVHDIEYGIDLPHHYTMRMLREHVVTRPAFRKLRPYPAAAADGRFQGRDFSHLPKKDRPDWHQKVDVEQELAR